MNKNILAPIEKVLGMKEGRASVVAALAKKHYLEDRVVGESIAEIHKRDDFSEGEKMFFAYVAGVYQFSDEARVVLDLLDTITKKESEL